MCDSHKGEKKYPFPKTNYYKMFHNLGLLFSKVNYHGLPHDSRRSFPLLGLLCAVFAKENDVRFLYGKLAGHISGFHRLPRLPHTYLYRDSEMAIGIVLLDRRQTSGAETGGKNDIEYPCDSAADKG